jgi:D-tyrosyl-tRNA(Tyr) deacylase
VRIVLQRVTGARVRVGDEVVGAIGIGLLALVGVARGDAAADGERLADKTASLRIFAAGDRPFDRSIIDVGGGVLCVSQFTLLGDLRRGNRPSWTEAAAPEAAREVIDAYIGRLRDHGLEVATGVFGAHMRVALDNDGPVTVILDSRDLTRPRRQAGDPGPGE